MRERERKGPTFTRAQMARKAPVRCKASIIPFIATSYICQLFCMEEREAKYTYTRLERLAAQRIERERERDYSI